MNDDLTGAELLAAIKPKRDQVGTGICLRPDLIREFHTENNKLIEMQAEDAAIKRLGSGGTSAATKTQARKVRKLEDEIEKSEIRFVFESMSKDRYQTLCEQNPPRPDDVQDQWAGYNRKAVSDAAVRMCLISPAFVDCTVVDCDHESCNTWQTVETFANPAEWEELCNTVNEVNGAESTLPKSALASRILDRGATTSRRRAAGE